MAAAHMRVPIATHYADPDDVEAPPDANIAIEAGSIGSSERDDRASSAVSFSSARRTTFALPEDKTHHCFISHKNARIGDDLLPPGLSAGDAGHARHDVRALFGVAVAVRVPALGRR